MPKPVRVAFVAVVVSCLAALAGLPLAEEPAPQTQAPTEKEQAPQNEVFTGSLMVLNAPRSGILRLRVVVERWTTDEERQKLVEAVRAGTDALVEAMDKMEAGYVQIDNNLRWPVRSAASYQTDKGRLVRFATNRPINYLETSNATRSRDYPIGFIELLMPPEGKGEGALLAATQVQFNAEGRLEVKSLPTNTGPQKVTNVESELVKAKKKKDKK
jgi:hypothetical protein